MTTATATTATATATNPFTLEAINLDKYFVKSVLEHSMRQASLYSVWSRLQTDNDHLRAAYRGIAYGVTTGRYDGLVITYFNSLTIKKFFKLVVLPFARACAKKDIITEGAAYDYSKDAFVLSWIEIGEQAFASNR